MIRAVDAGRRGRQTRLAAIVAAGLLTPSGEIDLNRISQLAAVGEVGNDSLHRLVMDRMAPRTKANRSPAAFAMIFSGDMPACSRYNACIDART
jgi:hypothetical protein